MYEWGYFCALSDVWPQESLKQQGEKEKIISQRRKTINGLKPPTLESLLGYGVNSPYAVSICVWESETGRVYKWASQMSQVLTAWQKTNQGLYCTQHQTLLNTEVRGRVEAGGVT